MQIFNIHEAKTHLSRLIEAAGKGQPFIIAKAGKPLVQVSSVASVETKRLGFFLGALSVPDDFDCMGQDEIAASFGVE